MPTYNYIDKTVAATFDTPNAVSPEDATLFLYDAIVAAGGGIVSGFDPERQLLKSDEGYVSADIRIQLPDNRTVWISVECPTDES